MMPSMPVSRVAAHSFCSSSLDCDVNERRQVGARRMRARVPGLEPCAALHKGQLPQVLAFDQQRIVETDVGGELLELPLRHALAVEPLLQIVEGGDMPVAHDQQLAVEHGVEIEPARHVGEAAADVVAGAREEMRLAAARHDLHANAVPFPLRRIIRKLQRRPVGVLQARATASAGGTPARPPRRACGPRPSSQANSGS